MVTIPLTRHPSGNESRPLRGHIELSEPTLVVFSVVDRAIAARTWIELCLEVRDDSILPHRRLE